MTAERAIQLGISSNVIELEKISADLPFGKAETAMLTADAGVFNNSSNKLDLKDNIRLLTSGGMQALLSKASINLANNEMSSDAPVDIKTQGSHITAGRMRIAAGGKVFVFEKRVRLKIDADRMKRGAERQRRSGDPATMIAKRHTMSAWRAAICRRAYFLLFSLQALRRKSPPG